MVALNLEAFIARDGFGALLLSASEDDTHVDEADETERR